MKCRLCFVSHARTEGFSFFCCTIEAFERLEYLHRNKKTAIHSCAGVKVSIACLCVSVCKHIHGVWSWFFEKQRSQGFFSYIEPRTKTKLVSNILEKLVVRGFYRRQSMETVLWHFLKSMSHLVMDLIQELLAEEHFVVSTILKSWSYFSVDGSVVSTSAAVVLGQFLSAFWLGEGLVVSKQLLVSYIKCPL